MVPVSANVLKDGSVIRAVKELTSVLPSVIPELMRKSGLKRRKTVSANVPQDGDQRKLMMFLLVFMFVIRTSSGGKKDTRVELVSANAQMAGSATRDVKE